MNMILLALRSLRREWRAGDLRLIIAAVVVATACLTSVTAFTDRFHRALLQQGNELLGADLVVRSSFAPETSWIDEARRRGLRTARTESFRSVISAGERAQLAEIKAVDLNYPLRGGLRTAARPGQVDAPTDAVPAAGSAWADHQLLALLELDVGDAVRVGDIALTITRVLTLEPDRGGSAFIIAPRLMMNRADLEATGLIAPGSIVAYRLLVAGEPEALRPFRDWIRPRLGSGASLQDVSRARPRFRVALDRGERFLGLCTLVSVLLAGVAIAWSARHYAERHLDGAAILRCLGASQSEIIALHGYQLILTGAGAGLAGVALGYVGQQILLLLLPQLLGGTLPLPGVMPAIVGVAVALVMLVGFALPPVLRLRHVPPLRVLRRDLGGLPARLWSLYAAAAAALAVLISVTARDLELVLYVLGGTLVTVAALAALALGSIRVMSRFRLRAGSPWRFGLANLARHAELSTGQAVAIGIGITAMLLLTVVRGDLFRTWENRLPPGTPNHFLINIQTEQRAAVAAFLARRGAVGARFSPLVRARLLEINGRPVRPADYDEPFARRSLERAANLSWSAELGDDNRVVAGRWWRRDEFGRALLSVEQEYARTLGIERGDVLTYRIGADEGRLEVFNLRAVAWDSFRPNFFLLAPPGVLESYPATLLTSAFVAPGDDDYLKDLAAQFPNLTDIDVGAVLGQVRRLIDRLNRALEFVFLFTLAAGVVVLASAARVSQAQRRQEVAVLRTVGARQTQLVRALLAEYAVLGALAGGMGALGAMLVGYLVGDLLLGLHYRINAAMLPLGIAAGTALVTATGLGSTWRLLQTPPWESLRRA